MKFAALAARVDVDRQLAQQRRLALGRDILGALLDRLRSRRDSLKRARHSPVPPQRRRGLRRGALEVAGERPKP